MIRNYLAICLFLTALILSAYYIILHIVCRTAFYHMGHSSAYSPIFARSVKSLIYHIFTHKVLTLRSYLLGARNLQFYSDAGKFRTGTSILMYTLYSTLSELLKYHRYKAPLDLSLISGVLIYGIYEVIIWLQHLEWLLLSSITLLSVMTVDDN